MKLQSIHQYWSPLCRTLEVVDAVLFYSFDAFSASSLGNIKKIDDTWQMCAYLQVCIGL